MYFPQTKTFDEYRKVDTDLQAAVSYTHLRAHETVLDLVCRLLLETKTPSHQMNHLDT